MSRRTTLGPISQSGINARAGLASRPSLGPARISNAHNDLPMKSRASIGGPAAAKMSLGMAMPRRSSIQPRGSSITTGRAADPRNIGDKQFMNASIRALVDYLTQHNFDHAISPKILTRPAVKDFNNIVMFLFRQIDPNFSCTGKFEDEVVAFFKHLGYPTQISKANIAAVGSPHAWPALLASLMWLIEILTYDEIVTANQLDDAAGADIDDPVASEKAFYAYLSNAYGLFLSGDDERYAELEEQFVNTFESKNALIREQISDFDEMNHALAQEIEEVESRRAQLPQLEAKKKDYLVDLGKFQTLIGELEKHSEKLDVQLKKRESEFDRLSTEASAMEQEVDVLRHRVNNQELSAEDVKRMVAERERLEQAQEQASENRQTLQRKVWESETALRDRVQALGDCARAYNAVAEDLKIVPQSAKYARGRNLTLDVDVRAKKRDGLLKTDIRNDIVPVLQGLRSEFSERTIAMRNDLLSEQDAAEDLHLKATELQEQQSIFEGKLKRAEEAYRREREALDQAAELHTREMDAMETRLARLRDTAAEEARAAAATRRAAEARAARDVRRNEHHRKKHEIVTAVMDVVSACASQRDLVEHRVAEVLEQYSDRLDSVISGSAAETVAAYAELVDVEPVMALRLLRNQPIEPEVQAPAPVQVYTQQPPQNEVVYTAYPPLPPAVSAPTPKAQIPTPRAQQAMATAAAPFSASASMSAPLAAPVSVFVSVSGLSSTHKLMQDIPTKSPLDTRILLRNLLPSPSANRNRGIATVPTSTYNNIDKSSQQTMPPVPPSEHEEITAAVHVRVADENDDGNVSRSRSPRGNEASEVSVHDTLALSHAESMDISGPASYNFAGLLEACARDDSTLLPDDSTRSYTLRSRR